MERLHGLCKRGFFTWIVPGLYKAQNHRGFLYVRVDRVPGLYKRAERALFKTWNHRVRVLYKAWNELSRAWVQYMSSKTRGTIVASMSSIRCGTIEDPVHGL